MKRKSKRKTKNNKTITISMREAFSHLQTPLPVFKKAGKKVTKDVVEHFTKRNHGWPLHYGMVVSEIFYKATGHHLENYLLGPLSKTKLKVEIVSLDGELVIRKSPKT